MAQYNNSMHTPDEWKLDQNSIPFRGGLIVIFMFLYGLKIQLRGPNRQRNLQLIQKLSGKNCSTVKYLNELVRSLTRFRGDLC